MNKQSKRISYWSRDIWFYPHRRHVLESLYTAPTMLTFACATKEPEVQKSEPDFNQESESWKWNTPRQMKLITNI